MNREIKQESSMPVQSRVSIIDLANLDMYWTDTGYSVKTMSQLVSWSMSLLYEVLASNNCIKARIDRVDDANRYLESRGLYQRSMREKGFKKLGAAIKMEVIRDERGNVKDVLPREHNILHNKRSVNSFDGRIFSGEIERMTKIYEDSEPKKEAISEESRKATMQAVADRMKREDEGESEDMSKSKLSSETLVGEKMTGEQAENKMKEIKLKDKERVEAEKSLNFKDLMKGVRNE